MNNCLMQLAFKVNMVYTVLNFDIFIENSERSYMFLLYIFLNITLSFVHCVDMQPSYKT